MKPSLNNSKSLGFTLAELMVAAIILVLCFVGILSTYVRCIELDEISRNTFTIMQSMRNKLETIRNTSFEKILRTYNEQTFTIPDVKGIGVIYVDNTNTRLLGVSLVFCWRHSKGRVLGEDLNLNGILDKKEDKNRNNKIDSPFTLFTSILYKK